MKYLILILVLIIGNTEHLQSQDGSLDESFGELGKVISNLGSDYDYAYSMALQANNKIVVGGTSKINGGKDFALVRYESNGVIDTTFGIDGIAVTDFNISLDNLRSIIIQPNDGKIISIGTGGTNTFDFAISRHNSDGTIDLDFGQNGKIEMDIDSTLDFASDIAIQENGKFIVVGGADYPGFGNEEDSDFALVRFNNDGTLDSDFGINGKVMTDFENNSMDAAKSIAIQNDGKLIVAGYSDNNNGEDDNFAIARYNTDGNLDLSFGSNGKVTTDFEGNFDLPNSVVIQSDGKIILAGYSINSTTEFALVRYNTDGSIDDNFGQNGKVLFSFYSNLNEATKVVLDNSEKIIVAGFSYQSSNYNNFSIARLNSDGTFDPTFGIDGRLTTDFNSNSAANDLLLQSDGKILLSGAVSDPIDFSSNFGLARYLSALDVGIVDLTIEDESLLLYPNPINQNSFLEYKIVKEKNISLQLCDSEGRNIKTYFINKKHSIGNYIQSIEIPITLSSGIYFLILSTGNKQISIKLVK